MWRYRILSPETYPKWDGTPRDGVVKIFEALGIGGAAYQLGKTKVFIKNPAPVFRLEEERDEKMEEVATRLQLSWRGYLVRKVIGGWFKQLIDRFAPVAALSGGAPVYGFPPSRTSFPVEKVRLPPLPLRPTFRPHPRGLSTRSRSRRAPSSSSESTARGGRER